MKRYIAGMVAIVIAFGAIAFTHKSKSEFTTYYFALKSGAAVGSTNPSDYQSISDPGCNKQITFCAITQVDNPTLSIPNPSSLRTDLMNLAASPNGHFNTSGQVIYKVNP